MYIFFSYFIHFVASPTQESLLSVDQFYQIWKQITLMCVEGRCYLGLPAIHVHALGTLPENL